MTVPALELEYACRRCEQITRREAANFYYGIRLLPRDKRHAMSAVYAFARRVDDIGDDGDLDRPAQLEALASEREGLAQIDADAVCAGDAVLVALADARRRFELPLDALELLIEGVELDVLGATYETFDELVGYCRRVAGTIGRLCIAIFTDGAANANGAATLADDLGVAMQLTNILRDIREDQQRGRMYLPAEDLERFGCRELDPAHPEQSAALIRFEAARAAEWFDRGLRLTSDLDSRSASCVLAMTGIYRTILDRIVTEPAQVLRGRISLPPWEKAWLAARSLATARPTGAAR
ncbi:MAG TPA: presqualene diphosphate synthase HpnD [Solirubrobacteraceae bacterium]|nr:presqualene diphosphate synthase HpnD [Solirubrobacteraceae bacterium]